VSLREEHLSKLNRVFQRRQSRISQALAISAPLGLAFATDSVKFGAKIDGHLRKLSGGSGGKRKRNIGLGLRAVHSTSTVASSLQLPQTSMDQGMIMGQSKYISMNAIDAWRRNISTSGPLGGPQSLVEGDDAFICEEVTLSPTSTISAVPWRSSL